MTWSILLFFTDKLRTTAIIAIYLFPIIGSFFKMFGLDLTNIRFYIIGGLLFTLFICLMLLFCPKKLFVHRKYHNYYDFCKKNINPFDEFVEILKLKNGRLKKHLGKYFYLYPFEIGFKNAPLQSIRVFSELEFKLTDNSKPIARYILSFILIMSIILLNVHLVKRITNMF